MTTYLIPGTYGRPGVPDQVRLGILEGELWSISKEYR